MGHLLVGAEHGFEGELRFLKLQQRFLHADRRQQHVVSDSGAATFPVSVQGRLMVDGPGILAATAAGGEAGHHHIGGLIKSLGLQRGGIANITEAHFGSRTVSDHLIARLAASDAAAFARERHDVIAPSDQLPNHETTDVSGGSEHHHPNMLRRTVSEVVAQRHDELVGAQQR